MLKVGIIGLGGIGRHHLQCYSQISQAQVVAVADVRAATLQQDTTVLDMFELPAGELRWYDTYQEMVGSGDLDAVDIGLPTNVHRGATVAALEAGLPVLCEKPMALTLADCDAMLEASERTGKLLMIAQCIRFWPEYQVIRDLAHSGKAGKLLSLQLWRGGPTPGLGDSWMADVRLSGGAILDLHIHDIDFCQYVLGLPTRIYAQGGMSAGEKRGYDYVLTNLDYGDGLQVSAASHWADVQMPFIARCEARFEDAFLRIDTSQDPSLVVYRRGATDPEYPSITGPDAYVSEIRYFLDCVASGHAPERCPAIEARNSVALTMAAAASLQRRDMVSVAEFAR